MADKDDAFQRGKMQGTLDSINQGIQDIKETHTEMYNKITANAISLKGMETLPDDVNEIKGQVASHEKKLYFAGTLGSTIKTVWVAVVAGIVAWIVKGK